MEKRASPRRDLEYLEQAHVPCPDGEWTGKLVGKSWGKSVNIICYFEDLATGSIHRCIGFRSRDSKKIYGARDFVVDFSEPGIEGRVYNLKTTINSKGNPAWLSARLFAQG